MSLLGDVEKVTRDVDGSTDPVFTKRTCFVYIVNVHK